MAAFQNFRSAFNGFHREDVVAYIEYTNNKHASQVNQLKTDLQTQAEELAELRAKLAESPDLSAQLAEAQAANADLTAQLASQQEELLTLKRELEEARSARQALEERPDLTPELELTRRELADLKEQLEQARQAAAAAQVASELEAYRRAERVERLACERVNRMYEQINGALADATVRTDETAVQLGDVADRITAQLAELQLALAQAKSNMKDAATAMYAIRPIQPEE